MRHSSTIRSLAVVSAVAVGTFAAREASAVTITFDDGAVAANATLANQYPGVAFVPGAGGATGVTLSGLGTTSFATNTNMIIVSSTGTDVGGGLASPISGLILRSFNGWLDETGDPLFRINFSTPIMAFSATFGGVSDLGSSRIYTVNGANVATLAATATTTGTSTLTATIPVAVSSIIITPGDFNDWVGIDNIAYTVTPEPASLGLTGVAAAGLLRRRRRA